MSQYLKDLQEVEGLMKQASAKLEAIRTFNSEELIKAQGQVIAAAENVGSVVSDVSRSLEIYFD